MDAQRLVGCLEEAYFSFVHVFPELFCGYCTSRYESAKFLISDRVPSHRLHDLRRSASVVALGILFGFNELDFLLARLTAEQRPLQLAPLCRAQRRRRGSPS